MVCALFNHPCQPRYTRRASWHDYKSRCIYMITVTKAADVPLFSEITGTPDRPICQLSSLGVAIAEELAAMCKKYADISILDYVIMPDHVHFLLNVKAEISYHIGTAIGSFKGACSRRYWDMQGESEQTVFQRGFHDRILRRQGQLKTMFNYVADNPRRLLIKRLHPELFKRNIHIVLQGVEYEALGNIFLLRNPLKKQVKSSRKFSGKQLEEAVRSWIFTVEENGVLVSPFISPVEKEFRDYALANGGNLIIIEENGLGERYKPGGKYFDLCAAGRLLIIAPVEKHLERQPMTRAKAMALNSLAALIASDDFEVKLRSGVVC